MPTLDAGMSHLTGNQMVGQYVVHSVDFYNGAIGSSSQSLSSAASDKNHTGGGTD